jgi:hypothetical protein
VLLLPFFIVLSTMSNLPLGFTDSESFSCWVPAQAVLVKSSKDGADSTGKRWVQGIASTASRDLQGEIVDQDGIDFSYFLKSGYFNNDHKPGFENKVGQPTECKITKNGLWVKGFLFKNHAQADTIWELLSSLAASDSDRRVGFSIQGKVVRRAGQKIQKCWIQDIAITPAPVNHTTWCEIAKSLSAQSWDLTKDKDAREAEEKALTAAGPLVPESLGNKLKEETTSKSFTFDEAVEHLVKSIGVDKDTAESIARITFSLYS